MRLHLLSHQINFINYGAKRLSFQSNYYHLHTTATYSLSTKFGFAARVFSADYLFFALSLVQLKFSELFCMLNEFLLSVKDVIVLLF